MADAETLLFKPEQGALVLGIGRSKIFELMATGEIPSVRIGRSRRISRQALEDYVARLCTSQTGDGRPAA